MRRVFADTAGLYAVLDRDDSNNERASAAWRALLGPDLAMVTTNYVLLETFALVQRRLGMAAMRSFSGDVLPVLKQEWVTPDDHSAALAAVLAAGRRDLSFVDTSSFQVMRRLGIRSAFTFDAHFRKHGFEVFPD
jgi:uncharacterized protein